MSYYKHAQYAFSHKLKRALKRGHHSAYGRYKAELAHERQRRLARFKVPVQRKKPK